MSPFAFTGRIRPLPYALASGALFFSQHLIALVADPVTMRGIWQSPRQLLWQFPEQLPGQFPWQFFLVPLETLARRSAGGTTLIAALLCLLIIAWALTALAFRRAADARLSGWVAALALAPVVQIPAILALSLSPSRGAALEPASADADRPFDWTTAALGLLAGGALTVIAVAIAALIFGAYGFGMFLISPIAIGFTTGYLANRKLDIGAGRTTAAVAGALLLGGIALLAAALEGVVCLIMAAPIALLAAVVGGLFGRAIAVNWKRPPRQVLPGLALLPLIFATEAALPAGIGFDTQTTIEIGAPPEAVWQVLLDTDLSREPVTLPFRLGVAYPLRGKVLGEGTGALRVGEFTTGTALERVTEWIPNRKLAFTMLNEVPAMRELSPYAHVHAPHVVGYFRTTNTSFELVRRASGTEVIEHTSHELRLEPVLYWLPLARSIVAANNARVLRHLKREAETTAHAGN
jgi:uncharacterized membrane protein YhaH (DUF805 family)